MGCLGFIPPGLASNLGPYSRRPGSDLSPKNTTAFRLARSVRTESIKELQIDTPSLPPPTRRNSPNFSRFLTETGNPTAAPGWAGSPSEGKYKLKLLKSTTKNHPTILHAAFYPFNMTFFIPHFCVSNSLRPYCQKAWARSSVAEIYGQRKEQIGSTAAVFSSYTPAVPSGAIQCLREQKNPQELKWAKVKGSPLGE